MRVFRRELVIVGSLFWAGLAATFSSSTQGAEQVVSAPPRTPQEEAKAFHLPPGFEVQLVAAEPDIHKPINIAFDDRGRLWVTDTVEYPFPAPENRTTKARDSVKILQDFASDGHAQKITTFADDLNIPVGVLPTGDASGIIYSIPGVFRMTDTTGSGHADKREILLSGQAHRDTHGMTGSFTRGFDGWIYAVHGFANESNIKGTDGRTLQLNSGNIYRFKPDGSGLEQFTHGQVNPFGLCVDPLGNFFASDCETKPVSLLIREAYYSSFGKPDDGLGFAPEMIDRMYGSSAIAGLCDYAADQFPPEYRDMLLVGNVVTNIINRCNLTARGSGFHGDDRPDFMTSDDAWFRPVNIKLGPDGALYVADFYNRIIGHYEVDLHHPGRDRERGRIWRIVYKGEGSASGSAMPQDFDLSRRSAPQLIQTLGDGNFTLRMFATQRLADQVGQPAIDGLKEAFAKPANPWQQLHAMWVLHRLGALDDASLAQAAASAHREVRIHAMRVLADLSELNAANRKLTIAGLSDADPMAARAAADALGCHPDPADVRPLLEARRRAAAAGDAFLVHTLRISLRDHIAQTDPQRAVPLTGWNEQETAALADVAVGVPTPGAATFLLDRLKQSDNAPRETVVRWLRHIARYLPGERSDDLAAVLAAKFGNDPDLQLDLVKSLQEGIAQRGGSIGPGTRKWAEEVAGKILSQPKDDSNDWLESPFPGTRDTRRTWDVRPRICTDGINGEPFFTSGEQTTGILRSPTFVIPAGLRFWLAGHNGLPSTKPTPKDIVRLRAVDTNEVLAEALPPRNDVAQKVEWDLQKFAGRQGFIEATDGDSAVGYAWLAFGRFEPAVLRVPAAGGESGRRQIRGAIELVGSLKIEGQASAVRAMLTNASTDPETRVLAARSLAALNPDGSVDAFSAVINDGAAPATLREAAAGALGQSHGPQASAALVAAMSTAPERLQLALAKALATTSDGAEALLGAVTAGKASPRLLQDANVRERIAAAKPANAETRVGELTANLPRANAQVQSLIDQRASHYDPAKASPQRGAAIFVRTCAACHRIAGQGAQIGPQLDGIGIRGVARLTEDVLDPSRNVDAAFRYSTFVLQNGDAIAGLPRREEGQTVVVADSTGKEVAIPKAQIKRQVLSNLSLMPSNFGEILKPDEFDDLMAYLLSNSAVK